MVSQRLSSWLNFLRWAAALMVVLSHLRPMLLVDLSQVEHGRAAWSVFYLLTSFGREAVAVFFVISGFLVGGIAADRFLASRRFSWSHYMVARFSRIYTVLLPALALGWGLDLLGQAALPEHGLYDGAGRWFHINSIPDDLFMTDNWRSLVVNMLMLQGIAGEPFGSNGPLWSLAYEWWYYILWGLCLASMANEGWGRLLPVLLGALVCWMLPLDFWLASVQWLMGAAMGVMLPRVQWRPRLWLSVAGFLGALLACRYLALRGGAEAWTPWQVNLRHAGLALSLCAVLWSLGAERERWMSSAQTRFHHYMAAASYTLYLTHFPLIMALLSLMHAAGWPVLRQQPSLGMLLSFMLLVLVCWVWSRMVGRVFERRTAWVRRSLSGMLPDPAGRQAA